MSGGWMEEEWAREVLADPATVILDTETTGLRGYCCEVTVMDPQGEFLIDTLVNPMAPVEPGARKVHGISDAELAVAPAFADVWPQLAAVVSERRIIVWNADFDSAVIRRDVLRLGLEVPALRWECAMRQYSDWHYGYPDAPFMRLNGGHRAGEDCKAVLERLQEMADLG